MATGYYDELNKKSEASGSISSMKGLRQVNPMPDNMSGNTEYAYILTMEYTHVKDQATYVDLTGGLREFAIYNKFDDGKFSIITAELVVNKIQLKDIHNLFRSMTIYVSMKMFKNKADGAQYYGEEFEPIWNRKKFRIIQNSNMALPPEVNADDKTGDTSQVESYPLSLSLISEDILNIYKENFNGVFRDVMLKDIIYYLIGGTKVDVKLYAQAPKNTDTIKQLIIPAGDIFEVLTFLDNYYGIYEGKGLFFADVDKLIIMDKLTPYLSPTAKINKVEITLFQAAGSSGMDTGNSYINEKQKKLQLFIEDSPRVKVSDIINRMKYGNDIAILNSNGKTITSTANAGITKDVYEGYDKKTYFWCNSSSNLLEDALKVDFNKDAECLELVVSSTVYTMITPEYKYDVKANYEAASGFEGTYRLAKVFHKFTRANGGQITMLSNGAKNEKVESKNTKFMLMTSLSLKHI
jgi:hypothetical protein